MEKEPSASVMAKLFPETRVAPARGSPRSSDTLPVIVLFWAKDVQNKAMRARHINSFLILHSGYDNAGQTGKEEAEHKGKEAVDTLAGALELLPDEYAPDGGNHRCALAQCV